MAAATITAPEQVPEPLLRLCNLVSDLSALGTRVNELIEELDELMPALGWPVFPTEAANEALYARAAALRGSDA